MMLPALLPHTAWPAAIANAPRDVWQVLIQFFAAELNNPNTRRSYIRGAGDFFAFTAMQPGGQQLGTITSLHVAAWLEDMKARGLAVPTIKQRLAGLRMLFAALVRERVVAINPATVVKGPRYSIAKGKTPVLSGDQVLQLLNAIDTDTLIGLRDRAMIGAMAYSFARIGSVTKLHVRDVFRQHRRLWLRLAEKNGKSIDVPCHHTFENYLIDWLEQSGIKDRPEAPLFQTFARVDGKAFAPSGRPMTQPMTWQMLQRRAAAADIDTAICNHTFRASGITAYLSNGGTIENAARIAGHSSIRTTAIYDRRSDDITLDEIEKIRFA